MGSVKIGDKVIIAPGSTIRNHLIIGDNVVIGLGSNVVNNIPKGEVWFGNPATKKKNNV